ncbi:MAG: hypothetical protein ACOY4W_18810, partial [Thermodesulfobacteriota bacterium]
EQKWNKLYFFVKIISTKQYVISWQRMDFESVGRGFESLRARQTKKKGTEFPLNPFRPRSFSGPDWRQHICRIFQRMAGCRRILAVGDCGLHVIGIQEQKQEFSILILLRFILTPAFCILNSLE